VWIPDEGNPNLETDGAVCGSTSHLSGKIRLEIICDARFFASSFQFYIVRAIYKVKSVKNIKFAGNI